MVIRAVALFDAYGNEIFYNTYANFTPNFSLINRVLLGMKEHFVRDTDSIELGQYRISIMFTSSYILSVLADRVNSQEEIGKILEGLIEKAVDIFGEEISGRNVDKQKLDEFEIYVENVIKMLPVKCTLTGYGGVGKTTIVKLVARGEAVRKHIPTILADVEELAIEGIEPFKVTLFTVAGQPEYWRTWMLTTEGSDFVVLVTDSSREDVERLQKEILPYLMKITPYSRFTLIANKQDLPDRLPASVIEELTGFPSYPMVAISQDAKERFVEILSSMIRELP